MKLGEHYSAYEIMVTNLHLLIRMGNEAVVYEIKHMAL